MKVQVAALFSSNKMIGSRIIAEGTHHLAPSLPKVSHTALLVNNRWVHESTGHGVKICSYDVWKKQHNEMARVDLQIMEYQQLADHFRQIQDLKYDYLGVIYLALCIIPTFWGRCLPKENKWASDNKFFCCEVLGFLTGKDYSMYTPIQILKQLTS